LGEFAFARFVSPEFVEVRGCVLLKERYDERNLEAWWTQLNGDRAAIEEVVNHVHLWDVVEEQVPDEALDEVAEALVRNWRRALAEQFPDRSFRVVLSNDENDYGPTLSVSTRS
jgi:hypothetical protein